MHFVGSNPATGSKSPKCIYKIPKNFRVEKNGEISRNLRFSLVFVPASKSDTHHGWGGRIRTDECQSQSLVPYRLATPQFYSRPIIVSQSFAHVKENFSSNANFFAFIVPFTNLSAEKIFIHIKPVAKQQILW